MSSLRTVASRSRAALPKRRAEPSLPSRGDTVVADDGCLGRVDEVVVDGASELAFLVVRTGPFWRRRRPVVASALVRSVSRQRREVRVDGGTAALSRLSESLPIVI